MLRPPTPCRISVSHTPGLAMLAVAPFPVGIDVEAHRSVPVANITGQVLTPRERRTVLAEPDGPARTEAFLRCWTRKEAVLKAVGIGIVADLTTLESRPEVPGPTRVTTGTPAPRTDWWVTEVSVPEGWTASVAYPAGTGRPIAVRQLRVPRERHARHAPR